MGTRGYVLTYYTVVGNRTRGTALSLDLETIADRAL